METLWQDLRYGMKMIARRPGFTAVTVLMLALGIGVNSIFFSIVDGTLFKPLPYQDAHQLTAVWEDYVKGEHHQLPASARTFLHWQKQSQMFQQIAADRPLSGNFTGRGEPEELSGSAVSRNFFAAFGYRPALGRAFSEAEEKPGHDPVIVLSHKLWERRFNSDPAVLGQAFKLDGRDYTIIGVMPPMPQKLLPASFYLPLAIDAKMENSRIHDLYVIGRLKPKVSLAQAQTELRHLSEQLATAYPDTNKGWSAKVVPAADRLVGWVRNRLLLLWAAVGFVLLIACVNIANLLLTLVAARERELAIRTALGAGRWRLWRQWLTESLLLSTLGGVAGMLLALWGVDLVKTLTPPYGVDWDEVALNARVLAFTAGLTILTGLLVGLLPAFQAFKLNVISSLGKGGTTTYSSRRLRNMLIVAEVALTLVLLNGAGLTLNSLIRVLKIEPGFDTQQIVTLDVSLPRPKYAQKSQQHEFARQLLEKVESLPGVHSAAITNAPPLGRYNSGMTITIPGAPSATPEFVKCSTATPKFFSVMGMTLLLGRAFTEQDREGAPLAVVVNDTFARHYWPAGDALGQTLSFGEKGDRPATIVGVLADNKTRGLTDAIEPFVYTSLYQQADRDMSLTIRSVVDPLSLVPAVREQVFSIDRDLPIAFVSTMAKEIDTEYAQPRFYAVVFGLFAGLAAMLAAVGIFGVVSYSVSQRTREIGIRLALGAPPGKIQRLIIKQTLLLTALGVGAGLMASLALTRYMEGLLYGIRPNDPITFSLVALALTGVAVLACYLPARRAMEVDPMVALRCE